MIRCIRRWLRVLFPARPPIVLIRSGIDDGFDGDVGFPEEFAKRAGEIHRASAIASVERLRELRASRRKAEEDETKGPDRS